MIIATHVLIALLSIGCATLGYIRPSNNILRASYALVAMTFTSGFILVWSAPAQMLQACVSGLVYVSVVTAVMFLARRRHALLQSETTSF